MQTKLNTESALAYAREIGFPLSAETTTREGEEGGSPAIFVLTGGDKLAVWEEPSGLYGEW